MKEYIDLPIFLYCSDYEAAYLSSICKYSEHLDRNISYFYLNKHFDEQQINSYIEQSLDQVISNDIRSVSIKEIHIFRNPYDTHDPVFGAVVIAEPLDNFELVEIIIKGKCILATQIFTGLGNACIWNRVINY